MMHKYTLAIIGAGLHGTMFYVNLPKKLRERTIVIDPHEIAIEQFLTQTNIIGMQCLRSPASHCMLEPLTALFSFARDNNMQHHFHGRYYMPSVSLFKQYISTLIDTSRFYSHHHQAIVKQLIYHQNSSWEIETSNGNCTATRVICALGMDVPTIPAPFLSFNGTEKHILHPDFRYPSIHSKHIAVIGGGMSGTQTALSLCSKHYITLIAGHPLRVTHFDSNPCFIGPKCRTSYLTLTDYQTRMDTIRTHRYPGTINPYVHSQVQTAIAHNTVRIHTQKTTRARYDSSRYTLTLEDGTQHVFDDIILATGYGTHKAPHANMLSTLARHYDLVRTPQGFPMVDNTLMWHDNLYITGGLAELVLGPPARNIIGAHLAYRILKQVWNDWQ